MLSGNPFYKLPFYLKKIVRMKVKNTLGGRLRVFIVGAAAANPDIVADFKALHLMTLQGYGLTECAPLVAGNTDFFQKDDSAGLPIPNVEYKIDNPNSEGIGEILVSGPNVMLGYYEDEEKTKQTIVDRLVSYWRSWQGRRKWLFVYYWQVQKCNCYKKW